MHCELSMLFDSYTKFRVLKFRVAFKLYWHRSGVLKSTVSLYGSSSVGVLSIF